MGSKLYSITQLPDGFSIYREGLINHSFKVEGLNLILTDKNSGIDVKFYIYHYRNILKIMTFDILRKYQLKDEKRKRMPENLAKWAFDKIQKGLGKALYPEWKRCVNEILDPKLQSFCKLACKHLGPKFVVTQQFMEACQSNYYLWQDLQKYHAAWMVATRVVGLHNSDNDYGEKPLRPSLQSWRDVFGTDRNRAFNKTLDSFPRGISFKIAQHLSTINLNEPITDRTKLLFLLSFAAYKQNNYFTNDRHNLNAILRSTPQQIKSAFKKFKKYYETQIARSPVSTLNLRSHNNIYLFVIYLADYPEIHNGTIGGLLQKSIDWHRELQDQRIANYLNFYNLPPETKVKLPPVKLPTSDNIRFLSTVQEVVEEGALMAHCVGSYVQQAVSGNCYLFHVNHKKEMATIAVSRNGEIQQSYGPRNTLNSAASYAKKELSKWVRENKKEWMTNL